MSDSESGGTSPSEVEVECRVVSIGSETDALPLKSEESFRPDPPPPSFQTLPSDRFPVAVKHQPASGLKNIVEPSAEAASGFD